MEVDNANKTKEGESGAVEGLKGTRMTTFMMLVVWGGAIVFR